MSKAWEMLQPPVFIFSENQDVLIRYLLSFLIRVDFDGQTVGQCTFHGDNRKYDVILMKAIF